MGFSAGRATFMRFKVVGTPPRLFDQTQLDQLADKQIGRQKVASADGSESGWTAGGHVLDTEFALEKNVVNDALLFDFRFDKDQPPGELLRAYYEVELKSLTKDNASGKPSVRQKREAKQVARDRVDQEAKDGRFKKRKTVPVVWHLGAGEVWFGTASLTHVDRFTLLFQETFGVELDALPAGRQAYLHAEASGRSRQVWSTRKACDHDDDASNATRQGLSFSTWATAAPRSGSATKRTAALYSATRSAKRRASSSQRAIASISQNVQITKALVGTPKPSSEL